MKGLGARWQGERRADSRGPRLAADTRQQTLLPTVCVCVCVCESYIGKPIGTRAVPQFTTGVAKPLTQIEPGKTEHHPPL